MIYIIAYVCTTIVFLAIDSVWLGYIAKDYYSSQLGDLMVDNVKLHIAAAFYLMYTIGIVIFAIKPALDTQSFLPALGYGALFGFLAYGTYDFTNMATLKNWPMQMSLIDIAWGTSITASAASIGYFITRYISGFMHG